MTDKQDNDQQIHRHRCDTLCWCLAAQLSAVGGLSHINSAETPTEASISLRLVFSVQCVQCAVQLEQKLNGKRDPGGHRIYESVDLKIVSVFAGKTHRVNVSGCSYLLYLYMKWISIKAHSFKL